MRPSRASWKERNARHDLAHGDGCRTARGRHSASAPGDNEARHCSGRDGRASFEAQHRVPVSFGDKRSSAAQGIASPGRSGRRKDHGLINATFRMSALAVALCLVTLPAFGQQGSAAQAERLLERLVGEWIMTGEIHGELVQYRLSARRVLNRRFVEPHMIDVRQPPKFEARVFSGTRSRCRPAHCTLAGQLRRGLFGPTWRGNRLSRYDSVRGSVCERRVS